MIRHKKNSQRLNLKDLHLKQEYCSFDKWGLFFIVQPTPYPMYVVRKQRSVCEIFYHKGNNEDMS